jgi:DNA modification methylase
MQFLGGGAMPIDRAKNAGKGNLLYVKGVRKNLDDTSRKILSAGRKPLARCYGQDLMKGENKNFRQQADKSSNLIGAPKKPEWATGTGTENMAAGTSIFDPVLCELMYSWFCPVGGKILDPFAGGSVRGIIAGYLGFDYTGIDLSARQIEANREQAATIIPDKPVRWIVGDSKTAISKIEGEFDFIFSCPPYGDLEVYSDNPADLSTMDYPAFLDNYQTIIKLACDKLKKDRFACFVVGDFRDKKGFYRNFVGNTIDAFQQAGATLYNEAILVTAVGSLPIRIGKQFVGGRKLGKTHQNCLVFYNGDPKMIRVNFTNFKVADFEGLVDETIPTAGNGEIPVL